MCEVTRTNFADQLSVIQDKILEAAFFAIDTEFTGLKLNENDRSSLFDTGEQRYYKLRKSVSKFTMCQIGLALFVPFEEKNRYEVYVYNFHLFPSSFGPVDVRFLCQASSLEFLCKHNFDFNRFVYEGIPYLNIEQEALLKVHLEQQDHLQGFEREADEKFIQKCCSLVGDWLLTAEDGLTLTIPVTSDSTTTYCLLTEIRGRFNEVWADERDMNIVVKKVSEFERKQLATDCKHEMEKEILRTHLGFTHIFRSLSQSKKPMLGHNNFTDIMLMYDKFYKPLPNKYTQFKKDVHGIFPCIYDTKHISNSLRRSFESLELLGSSALGPLYKELDSDRGRLRILFQPSIKFASGFDKYSQTYTPHEAGFDAYMCGYVFLRILHILYHKEKDLSSTNMRCLSMHEYFSTAKPYRNSINLIRAAVNHMRFGEIDPESNRPPILYVHSRSALNPSELIGTFAQYAAVDFQIVNKNSALVAAGNVRAFKDILNAFDGDKTISVSQYSIWKHSRFINNVYAGALVVAGALCVWKLFS